MESIAIRAQVIVTWHDLHKLGIEGLLKGDTVYIRELEHHTSREYGHCVLIADKENNQEWVIPIIYLKILDNADQKNN